MKALRHGKAMFYKHGKLALRRTLSGSLYLVDGETASGENHSGGKKPSMNEIVLCHRRLGHMHMRNLQILSPEGGDR